MKYAKKSLGQNFLIDRNIIRKIINLINIKNKNIIEIGPGKGALTEEILKKNPKSLKLIEKDNNLSNQLNIKFFKKKKITIYNTDILKFNLEKVVSKNSIIFGNLPYNISSQILVKMIKFKKWPPKYTDLIFMFQKELGEKIIGKYLSPNYSRLSILSSFRLDPINKFQVSAHCFFPKPKVTSIVIHFKVKNQKLFKIKKINNLEKITNIFFSNKRKMINKSIKKIFNSNQINKLLNLNLKLRPANIKPEIYYRITELFEKM
jgi:16S rRNA (adenine1518-N6/adenine1519-N6)-dimethyltransferase